MKGRNCCVSNCRRRSHDHRGRKILNGLTFHCIPAWRTTEGGQISGLTRRRRAAWLAAVDRSDVTFDHIPASMRVCSRHFHSGELHPGLLQHHVRTFSVAVSQTARDGPTLDVKSQVIKFRTLFEYERLL